MGLFENFPWTDFHNLNIDFILKKLKKQDADIEKINNDINDINDNIGTTVEEVVDEKIEDGTIGALINDQLLDNVNGRITQVERETPVRAGNNIVFIGDSWTVGSGATNPSTERFTTLIASEFGMNEFNYGVGAAGFTRPNTFLAQLETANSNMTSTQKLNTSIVLITGGVNDIRWSSETTMSAFTYAVTEVVARAKEIFTNAQICLAIGTTTNNSYTDTNRHWYYTAMKAVKNMHTEGRVLIIDHVGAAINGVAANYASDDLHPNTTGHSILAGFLANAIQGGGTDTEYYVGTYTLDDTTVSKILTPHVFRQTENILFGQGIYKMLTDVSTNTLIGSYTGPFGYENIYMPIYHGNVQVGSFVITDTGNIRLVPYSGVTLATNWELRILDHVELFRTLID